jgi:enhancer of mRNA-decapping protein 4
MYQSGLSFSTIHHFKIFFIRLSLIKCDFFCQLMTMQKDLQKQMSSIVATPVTKEGRRVEASLGRNMEKSVKANVDALWARFLEENAKREKAERDRVQQMTNLITNSFSKELPAIFEKTLKKEITALGPVVARAVTPVVEKTISSVVAESVQVCYSLLLSFWSVSETSFWN